MQKEIDEIPKIESKINAYAIPTTIVTIREQ
jgi:hypothetical protein